MSYNFRKIFAKDSLFLKTKEIHKNGYAYFQQYADNLTKHSGRSKSNKSGKARSYANYLIRLVIFYQELFGKKINNLLTFATLKEIEKVVNSEGFKEYNENENRFPNATFNCYVSCVTQINEKRENIIDLQLNEILEAEGNVENSDDNLIKGAQKRKEKVRNGDVLTYPRNKEESLEAKRLSEWQCELNSNHLTFTSNINQKPYMEAHHLIPMSAQDYFEYTLDFADNIVCLCPNCHRKIHHAKDELKKEMVKELFKMREKKYNKYGINITYKQVLRFYGIV